MADFLPRQDDALVTWLVNFQSKVAAHAVALGLTAAQVTALQERCGRVSTAIQAVTPAQSALAAAVTAKETAKTTELPALRGELNLIKANPRVREKGMSPIFRIRLLDLSPFLLPSPRCVLRSECRSDLMADSQIDARQVRGLH